MRLACLEESHAHLSTTNDSEWSYLCWRSGSTAASALNTLTGWFGKFLSICSRVFLKRFRFSLVGNQRKYNRYKQDRRKKDNKAKHKATELKEVKMSYKIETHDYDVRLRNAKKFISQGHRVRKLDGGAPRWGGGARRKHENREIQEVVKFGDSKRQRWRI